MSFGLSVRGLFIIYMTRASSSIRGEQGLAYLRTDIGGAYKLNSDDSWTPLTDFVNDTTWHDWGTDALATDPVDTNNV